MKAVVFDHCGDPAAVLQVRDVPMPRPGRGEVRIRMLASPVNPSDLLFIQGAYGQKPRLPATPGFEGVGVVEESGGGLLGRRVLGRRVAVINDRSGNWQEHVIIPARQAIPVPENLADEQVAMFFVNPASALAMVQYILRVPRGCWLLQSAAGSALGRMVIRLGKECGFRTINLVRRAEQVEELRQAGGDVVLCTSTEPIVERVLQLTAGKGVSFALDAVSGTTGAQMVECLGRGGRMLVYGVLANEPMRIESRTLIVGQKRVEGFWLSEWMRQQRVWTLLGLFRRIGKMMRAGLVTTKVQETYPLEAIATAVRCATEPGRSGKVLLRIGTRTTTASG